MTYQLGGEFNFKTVNGEIVIRKPKDAQEACFVGFRAFARNNKTGTYREVFGLSQEQEWVDGTNEGFWFHHTHDSRENAVKLASKAYRWLNK